MIIISCEQNTPEWEAARLGIPTASAFSKIITPTGEKSKQWEAYAHEILAEEMLGHSVQGYSSPDMEEGHRREEESVSYYELQRGVDAVKVGFVLDDARTMGCSPDRFIGADGVLEMKNPKHGTMVSYFLDKAPARDHWPQIQGGLLITHRYWTDFMPYFPGMPDLIVRCERDEPYLALMRQMLADFNGKLAAKRARLIELGYMQKPDDPSRFLKAG